MQHNLPVKVILLKNNSLAEVKFEQAELGNPSFGCDLAPIDDKEQKAGDRDSRRRRGFCCRGQPLADCDFNLAALHPAYPIKCRTSTQRTQAPESVDTRKASALDPLENNIRRFEPSGVRCEIVLVEGVTD